MLTIRLSRQGRKKQPFYRVVLTEHTKPAKSGYQKVLGRYNPLNDQAEYDIEAIKSWIEKGAKPSERLAKLLFAATKDELFQKYFVYRTRTAQKKKEEEKKEDKPAEADKKEEPKAEEPKKEEKTEEKKEEAPKVEEKKEDKPDEADKKEEAKEEKKAEEPKKEEKAEEKKEEAPKEEAKTEEKKVDDGKEGIPVPPASVGQGGKEPKKEEKD